VSSYSPLYPVFPIHTPRESPGRREQAALVSGSLSCYHSLKGGKEKPSRTDERANAKCLIKQITMFQTQLVKFNQYMKIPDSTLTVGDTRAKYINQKYIFQFPALGSNN
jgi:hypothetical protein